MDYNIAIKELCRYLGMGTDMQHGMLNMAIRLHHQMEDPCGFAYHKGKSLLNLHGQWHFEQNAIGIVHHQLLCTYFR
ncbi:hypothetical protein T05_12937 [Trichinella murrelli]|uniref:Uncharacterized protein n=1 Tax=Trichinella murrelli TaxID=144512 RepID=A0A0V0U4K8_9BILA|nr:hypothetical protein T05_12937 [Trichinella murrelli]